MSSLKAKLGWKAGTEQYSPRELLDYAILAEDVGFDSIDASDHFHPWSERGQACFVWTSLGAAAVKTNTITIGTGGTCPILRYHPAIIAQAAATLACLIPDRTFLGLGTGEALNEYAATGLWPAYKTRQAQVIEAIELIRALWSGETVTYHGSHYQTHKAKLYTLCDKKVPLFVSAMTPGIAWFAGRHGDGLITVGGKDPNIYKEILKNFAAGASEAGRDPQSLPRIIELGVDFTADVDKAVEARKAYWAAVFVPALFTERIYTPTMAEQNGAAVGSDTIRQSVCVSPDPEVHVRNARHYLDST